MVITLTTPNSSSEIDSQNFDSALKHLEDMLEPGMPVLIQNFKNRWPPSPVARRRTDERTLFLSDGTVLSNGTLGVLKGERNQIIAGVGKHVILIPSHEKNPHRFIANQRFC